MIVKQYIKDFENLGLGMFVHFGLYSLLEQGEWSMHLLPVEKSEYAKLAKEFSPDPQWAKKLVATAKNAGCKYITLTTRHHDGYSLYDTCGLSDYDAPHSCGRDLVREFVDACNAEGIIPFFYHTLIDWYHPGCPDDWYGYMDYLQDSVELLCKNYGKIGGLWFDGYWAYPQNDWRQDQLYGMIRSYQPEAMIINNTGLDARGALGHIELDSVTFERGKPQPLNMEGAPKYVASEMCEVLNDHWGYAKMDFDYKAPAQLITEIVECRRYGANMLLNVGPMGNGLLRPIDTCYFDLIGQWVAIHDEAIRKPRPTGIAIEEKPDDFVLQDGDTYYLFCLGMPMQTNENVGLPNGCSFDSRFPFDRTIQSVVWMDNGDAVAFEQQEGKTLIKTKPFSYGRSMVVRIAKIQC